jgi:hypothetical protein
MQPCSSCESFGCREFGFCRSATEPSTASPLTRHPVRPWSVMYLRCSFCNKSQREGVRVIAGPRVYICRECVSICNQILAEDGAEDQAEIGVPDRRFEENGGCSLCGSNLRLEEMTSVPGCGRICSVCLEAVAAILPASPGREPA